MGAQVSVVNDTPYTWHYATQDRGFTRVGAHSRTTYEEKKLIHRYIYIRYDHHTWNSFRYEFNTHKGDTSFILRETYDRSQIQMHCTSEGGTHFCPNYGKIEEDERQRRQEEERRRQERVQQELDRKRQMEEYEKQRQLEEERRRLERLEREQRIQQELDRESESSRLKLSRATERLREKQSFRGHEQHHERTHVLHQQIEDDAAAIERDEVTDVEEKFKDILLKYQITEDKEKQDEIWDRIKTLQNEIAVQYCRENNLSVWSQFTFDHAIGYNELSLTEKLTVLEASLQLILHSSTEDAKHDEDQPLGWEKKYDFLLGLVEQLHATNPTLAEHILLNVLDMISELSPQSRGILGQILFNRIWTPTEIMLFVCKSPAIKCDQLDSVLHTAQTYHLDCIHVLSALTNENPLKFLEEQIQNDKEKDADTIVKELRKANCPEKVLVLLKDVLRYVESELPKYQLVDLTEEQIADLKKKITSLNLTNPDISILKDVLIGMSIAVQDCSTITTKDNTKIQGYFPRCTQLASLLLLLLAQLTEDKGCLLEIGTGEGKSCILAMFATMLAIRGTKVDIVTSSPVLARRDHEEWKKFFEMFGVTSSVVPPLYLSNCSPEEQEKRLEDAYRQQIVYGTVGVFAADTLKQEFEKRTTRGTRQFELVIVDEVDYMTLDNGVQVTFLSHESTGFRHVEQVLSNIWTMISTCKPIEMLETGEIKWATRIQYIHKAVTAAVMGLETDSFSANEILLPGVNLGFYTQEDIEMLYQDDVKEDGMSKALPEVMKKLGVSQQYDLLSIFEEVLENSAVFKCYSLENMKAKCFEAQEKQGDLNVEILLLEGGLACEIMSEKTLIDATVSTIKSYIMYSDNHQTAEGSNNFIVIPVFLKSYVENQLPVFVENALRAVEMSRGREYMIDTSLAAEREVSDRDKSNAIIPVDFKASGVLEKNKKWGNGLQQFLEFKHQLAISPISNVTNYKSNFHYFQRYLSGSGIFGVSGTLGGKADQDFLARHYEAKSYTVPAHRHKRVVELPVVQVKGGNHQWIQTICETLWKVADRGQVALVICEDVKTADELHEKMKDGGRFKAEQITLYTISEKHNIEKEKFCAGRIIIATNLGGRGTDIKVDESVNKCGGLFVLLTHFPPNRRVEKQIFGRTSRKGNPGMVQMVVNCDHLAPAYQGQSVEIMRQLREDYEIKRIQDMESDELVEINLKEKLFSTFCTLLKDFDGHYTQQEKLDPMQMQLQDIPDCFKHHQHKFDYQPAINALKESWALWLTLHEDHINRHDDIRQLEADLIRTIKETSEKLLRGECDNFYDHIKQAIVRTNLHCRDKSDNAFGAESYWQKVVNSDPHYKAVALYNQAYITINLGKGNYKADAMKLLEGTKESIDVYVSEVSNTMVSCNLSVTGNKDQSSDNNNFHSQMEARMDIFKSWKTYIDNALAKLKELEENNHIAITEECSVYMLAEEKNFIVTNELRSLYDYGLGVVFEVKQKPKFCIDALICFILGVVQVLAGVLVCALTLGTASQFGMGLISEGVSDMVNGIEGMINGTFDWASWAISKSISIGLALLTAGFSVFKKAVTSVYEVTKGLLNGTKSFSSVASEFVKSGNAVFTSFKGSVKSGLSSIGKESFRSGMKNMTSSTVLRQNFKFATKYAVQEIGKKTVLTAMNYAIDAALQEVFKKILQSSFENAVTLSVKQSSELDQALVEFISSGIPKAALNKENFKIDQNYEKQIKKSVDMFCEEIIPHHILDCTKAQDVISKLSEVCEAATELMNKAKLSGVLEMANLALKVAEYSTTLCQILGAVPTNDIIQKNFVPELLKSISEIEKEMTKYDQDGRHGLHDVQRLKGELLQIIAHKVSEQFISSCSEHMTSLMTSSFKSELNSAAGQAVDKVMRKHKTQHFFDDQREKHNKKSASHKEVEQLSDEDKTKLMQYTEDMCKTDQPVKALDVYVLTKSNLLDGKGIQLTVVDENGKQLTNELYPGTTKSAGDIKLRLTQSAKAPNTSQADAQMYSGHFDIVQDDGKIISVNSDHQNALYHAVAQATGSKMEEALMLRKKVQNEIQTNLELYKPLLILQRGYDFSNKNPRIYNITGAIIKETDVALQKYIQSIKFIRSDERILIKMYHLGFVGAYNSVQSAQRSSKNNTGTLNTSHIPPKDSIRLAQTVIENSNSNLIAMEVLGQDHRRALTTGPSSRSQMARKLLADTMISGDVELLLKRCMILHHPFTSQKLREALGDSSVLSQSCRALSDEGIRGYYKAGYRNLVSEYSRVGILDQTQCGHLYEWVNQDRHEDTNTEEYGQLLQGLQGK
ncbi:preprotein translocase subunit SecA [Pimephales promelas]|nr:preprotein translocase subunit SecA [Pimephales promelas]